MMQTPTSQWHNKLAFFLIAPSFDERIAVQLISDLREASIPVQLVGITPGLIVGIHGISLKTDCILSKLDQEQSQMLIFPSGHQSIMRLLVDPRIPLLIHKTIKNKGYLVGDDEAFKALIATGVMLPEAFSYFVTMSHITHQTVVPQIIDLFQ